MKGKRLGNVVLGDVIGKGGMGTVYAGHHDTLDIDVAVKVLPAEFALNDKLVSGLLREARAAAKVNHPNVVRVYDCGEEDGIYYLVMEFVDGKSCGAMLNERKKLPVDEAVRYIADIAVALAEISNHNIVHCDVKPANILVTKDGCAKLADLGIARILQAAQENSTTGDVVSGTPYYMAPEQAKRGGVVDQRTDIYGLGATFYHLITGKPLFEGEPKAVMRAQVKNPHRPVYEVAPEIPEEVCSVVERMLKKDPAERYQKPSELVEGLRPLIVTEIRSLGDLCLWFSTAIRCYVTHIGVFSQCGAVIAAVALACMAPLFFSETVTGRILFSGLAACLVGPLTAGLLWSVVTAMRDPLFNPEIKQILQGFRWILSVAPAVAVCEAAGVLLGEASGVFIVYAIMGVLLKGFQFFAVCAAVSGTWVGALPFKTLALMKDNYQVVVIAGLVGWGFDYLTRPYSFPLVYALSMAVVLPLCCCLVARFCAVKNMPKKEEADAGVKEEGRATDDDGEEG